jgi:hypothetical protein
MSEIIIKAIEKLENEANSVSGQNVPAIAIYNFLKEKCSEDEIFSGKILIATKSLSKCFSYIMETAYIRAKEQHEKSGEVKVGVGMSSDEIFALAVEYFNLDNEAIERKKEEEKKAAEERRKKAEEKRKAERIKNAAKAKSKKSKQKKETPAEKTDEKPKDNEQISLF